MTIADLPARWMAYRMQGFGGLVVPESVRVAPDGRMWTAGEPGWWLSRIPSDGPLFDSRDECVAECRRRNATR